MLSGKKILPIILLSAAAISACNAGNATFGGGGSPPPAPSVSTTAAQNGAVIVSLGTSTASATLYYTVDGSTPTTSSQQYQGPFLVASNLTVKAIAVVGSQSSDVGSQSFSPNIPSGTLVWSDEFTNTTGAPAQPIRRSGPTTPAAAGSATTNWRHTAGGVRQAHLAARRTLASTLGSMAICTSSRNNLRPVFTRRRA